LPQVAQQVGEALEAGVAFRLLHVDCREARRQLERRARAARAVLLQDLERRWQQRNEQLEARCAAQP
jgi:hypothetical protein